MLRHLIFHCPSGLLCIFSNVCIIFLFVAKVACFPWRKKVCVIVLFCCPGGLFWGLRGSIRILVGGPWGPIGNSLGSLPLGFFWGSLFFLGLWEHPKFRGSLFFGTTLEWIFLKVDPVKSIWVFLNSSFGFHGLMLNRTVDKIQNASRQRNFNLVFCYISFLNCCNYFFQPQSNPPEEGYYFSYLVFFMFCFYVLFFSRNNNIFNIIVYVNSISNF